MYLSAQRVRSVTGVEGINVHVYTHRGRELPGMTWAEPDVVRIAERDPGSLMVRMDAVRPGGNAVLSYLDVACADACQLAEIAKALEAAAANLPAGEAMPIWRSGAIALRAYLGPFGPAGEQLRELRNELLLVLRGGLVGPVPHRAIAPDAPLRIVAARDEIGVRYSLHADSFSRLSRHGLPLARISVGITNDNRDVFEQQIGDVHVELAQILSGRTLDQIQALGGVVFEDAATGERFWDSRQPER